MRVLTRVCDTCERPLGDDEGVIITARKAGARGAGSVIADLCDRDHRKVEKAMPAVLVAAANGTPTS